MKFVISVLLSVSLLFPCVGFVLAQDTFSPLTNRDILMMINAKLPSDLIIEKINSSACNFDTFPSVLAELKHRGVPDDVLLAMVQAPRGEKAKPPEQTQEQHPKVERPQNVGGIIRPDRSETPYNARFFVAPMEEGFDGLISALMIEKKLPISIVADDNLADFIVVGGTNKGPHKWYDTVFGGGYERDRNQGSIQVIRVKDKTVIWAAQKGDRSIWWGSLKKGGRRKVAERLVNKMKGELFRKSV